MDRSALLRGAARRLAVPFALLLCAGVAHAGDFYVDPVNGDDANGGTSWSDALRSLRNASLSLPDPPAGEQHTLHVAEGLLAPSTGQSFPVYARHGFRIRGAGVGRTVLDGGGSGTLLRAPDLPGPGLSFEASGLTLRGGHHGVYAAPAPGGGWSAVLTDLVIEDMQLDGVYTAIQETGDTVYVDFERVRVQRCLGGLVGVNFESHNALTLNARDCEFLENRDTGVYFDPGGSSFTGSVTLERCRIERNRVAGIQTFGGSGCCHPLEAFDCSISSNRGHGLWARGGLGPAVGSAALTRCTVVDNALAGVRAEGPFDTMRVDLNACILWGNGDDLDDPGGLVCCVELCDIGDGDFAGIARNFSADPLFVDRADRDYRLRWGSPCIDAGELHPPVGARDLYGAPRDVDGDLDRQGRGDVGANEFRPLQYATAPGIGGELVLELRAPPLASATLWRSFLPTGPPVATPHGAFRLGADARAWLPVLVGPGGLSTVRRRLPDLPGLAGRPLSFQALVDGPAGPAWTNAVTATLD